MTGLAAGPIETTAEAMAQVPVEYRYGVAQRLTIAGGNRAQILDAIMRCPAAQREGLAFLLANMPDGDLKTLKAELLLKNVALAYEAREKKPWAKAVPTEIFLDAVLPYANVNERRDDWRGDFAGQFSTLVKDCTSTTEAAQLLNREIFKTLNVQYHATKRRKPDQSPYESTEIGYASCTGLAILLADACRAVGVPARVVGTPRWADDSGNHTWVEFWDGQWWYIGAAEPGALNETWFSSLAAKADDTRPENRIYAASFRKTETPFIMIWSARRDVPAVDVSKYYVHRQKLSVSALDAEGRAVPATIRLVESGRLVGQAEGTLAKFEVAANEDYVVHAESAGLVAETKVHLGANADATHELKLGVAKDGPGSAGAGSTDVVPPTAAFGMPSSSAAAPEELRAWLAKPRVERSSLAMETFASAAMSKEAAAGAAKALWDDHAEKIKAERETEWNGKEIEAAGKKMKFLSRTFGTKPADGWNLYISMHGGGGAPASLNDSQWQNQIKLYQPKDSIYIAPRAPTNTWNLWHEGHIDALFDRMIEDAIVLEGVNPNRVYIMGYSAGGDGVYQLAPRMADRLAAASMMAGHPNDASPLGLRNIGFTIHVGALDDGFNRNKVAEKWKGLLDDLQKEDPKGYEHDVQLHAGRPHWMNLEDKVALDYMAKFTRNPLPEKVVWKQSTRTHERFYWLAMPKNQAAAGQLVIASRSGQHIEIERAEGVKSLTIMLSDAMLDLDKPVTVGMAGRTLFDGKVTRTVANLAATLDGRGDPALVFPARVTVEFGEKR
jgi:hypothetical protein